MTTDEFNAIKLDTSFISWKSTTCHLRVLKLVFEKDLLLPLLLAQIHIKTNLGDLIKMLLVICGAVDN